MRQRAQSAAADYLPQIIDGAVHHGLPNAGSKPCVRQTGSSPGDTSLVHPQPLRQILKRDQDDRIIATHHRFAHPGPHRPTLTMPQLHHQIRQRIDARKCAYLGRTVWKISENARPTSQATTPLALPATVRLLLMEASCGLVQCAWPVSAPSGGIWRRDFAASSRCTTRPRCPCQRVILLSVALLQCSRANHRW